MPFYSQNGHFEALKNIVQYREKEMNMYCILVPKFTIARVSKY